MKPRFKQISAVAVTDVMTSDLIPIVYALSEDGRVWQKIASKDWELLSDQLKEGDPRRETR